MAVSKVAGGERERFRLRHGTREVAIPNGALVVGRAPDCDLRLAGGLVSRHHARFTCTDQELVVSDLESRNGVLVNQRRIHEPTHLTHADVVGIGLESLEVIDEQVLRHPPHLSTMPPATPRGESDVDEPERQSTLTASVKILTDREREVLELIVLGHTQREIAQKLFVSVKTIETHRARVVEKLGCQTRAELVSYAISAGLLQNALRSIPQGKP
jgi:DNA-binding CsgD family transcriptional regulator